MLDERRRHRLIDAFKESHGEETAIALAEGLFSTEFATKADLADLAAATKADLAALETRLTTDLAAHAAATKADLNALETRLTTDLKALERRLTTATKADLDALETRVTVATRAEIDVAASRQIRWLVTSMLAFLALVLAGGGIATTILLQAFNSAVA